MATAKDILRVAIKERGIKEAPPRSNRVKYNDWYYGRPVSGSAYPWCMVFVQWCADQAGVALPVKTASCGALMRAAQEAGMWVTSDYRPGDIVIYNFPGGGPTDHCGIIESVKSTHIVAIEGNTGSTSDADGGEVQRRSRPTRSIVGAVRPKYEEETMEEKRYQTVLDCPSWAQPTVRKLIKKGALSGTGKGLDLSRDMVRLLVIFDRMGSWDK